MAFVNGDGAGVIYNVLLRTKNKKGRGVIFIHSGTILGKGIIERMRGK